MTNCVTDSDKLQQPVGYFYNYVYAFYLHVCARSVKTKERSTSIALLQYDPSLVPRPHPLLN